jgi:hypothetical protein
MESYISGISIQALVDIFQGIIFLLLEISLTKHSLSFITILVHAIFLRIIINTNRAELRKSENFFVTLSSFAGTYILRGEIYANG